MKAERRALGSADPTRWPVRTVLFDLDGTLLDTAPDMAYALNRLLEERHRPCLPFERIRPLVSNGSAGLIRYAFQRAPQDPDFEDLRQRFLALYRDNLVRDTRVFPGMDEVLSTLESARIQWGVVTNKPAWLTDPLLQQLGLWERAACVVSGDTTQNRKPHPEPLYHACKVAGHPPQRCLYVGDAKRDIEAGQRAGMKTLVALFGYLGDEDGPESWGADGMVEHPADLLDWIAHEGCADDAEPV
ncbi:MAG: phosphoglycolate phosphatase [Chromatiales bacterium 21-64-14]|nr:MAG: phosphoglycolate phosphatase [Chromatiales bacterium 21-64-14]HQU15371.1 phosphoglycolate phosphatase [Gammaproteobacteria bacterium]